MYLWKCNSMQSDASGKEVNGPAFMGIQKNSWYFEWEVCVGRQLWRGRDCQIISWVCKQAGDKFPQSSNTMLGRGWELCCFHQAPCLNKQIRNFFLVWWEQKILSEVASLFTKSALKESANISLLFVMAVIGFHCFICIDLEAFWVHKDS